MNEKQMSLEDVHARIKRMHAELNELERNLCECSLQNARWEFPEDDYSVLATWLLYDPIAHNLFPVAQKKSWAELGSRLSEYVGWTVDWYSLRRTYTRKNLKNSKK